MADDNEQRRFHRINFDAPVDIQHGDESRSRRLLDISLHGALIETSDDWSPETDDSIKLHLDLGGDACCIDMEGRIAHVADGQVGMICDHIDVDSIARLRRLVELNLGDSALLERDMAALIAS